jgi:tellurite resistance protein
MVLEACARIITADKQVGPAEMQALRDIAKALGLQPDRAWA